MEQSNSLGKLKEFLFRKPADKDTTSIPPTMTGSIKNTIVSNANLTSPVAGQMQQTSNGNTSIYTGSVWTSIGNTGGTGIGVVGGGIGATNASGIFNTTANYNSANMQGSVNGTYSVGSNYTSSITGVRSNLTAFSLFDSNGKVIVEIDKSGDVVWPNGIKTDAAAQELSKAIRLGAEIQAGITGGVKAKIRDMVFNEMITIATQRGTLTADDLTLMLEASKIMEKLKGINIED